MQDLTLVGVHDDGDHLVLGGPDGQRYLLKVDEPLRAAVRRDRARLAQLQIEIADTLRPRDIQARIRAGRTAEDVAAEAGVPVEHVRRYEGPVLAEREFVARQARGVRVRRAAPGAPGSWPTLDELVAQRLAAREVDAAGASWDAWRTDGTWFIRLTFVAGGRDRQAEWSYDVQLRHVTPLDDEARWFVDEPSPAAAAGPLPGPGRRGLAPVRDGDVRPAPGEPGARERVYDVEADGGLRPVEDERASAAAATVDLLDTLRERRGRRQWLPDPADDPDTPDALERAVDTLRVRSEALGEPPAAHPPRSRPDQLEDAEFLALPESPPAAAQAPSPDPKTAPAAAPKAPVHAGAPASPAVVRPTGGSHPAGTGRGTTAPRANPGGDALDLDAAADRDRSPSRRARRASVPSWDDIVFGSRRE
jgi:hypothetical protein